MSPYAYLPILHIRMQTRPRYYSIGGALAAAEAALGGESTAIPAAARGADKSGPCVIADVWDNPGGGTAGDATWIVRRCIDERVDGVAFSTVWDPQAVRLCHAAGEGATLQLRFGGKTAPAADSGEPIDARVTVLRAVRNATHSFASSIVPLGGELILYFCMDAPLHFMRVLRTVFL